MQDGFFHDFMLGALALALIVAAFTDIRRRQIDNWLNIAIALGAPLFWLASGIDLWPDVPIQIGMSLATFVVLAGLFAIGVMGGGDVKLLSALALWLPPTQFLQMLVIMAIVGGVLTLAMGAWHIVRRQREKLAIPYGVAIAIGGLWILSLEYLPHTAPAGGLAG